MAGRHGYSETGLENRRREWARRHPRRALLKAVVTLVVVFVPLLAVPAFLFGLPAYDQAHPRTLDCRVDGVAVGITSGRYSHSPYVRFSSPDCGVLLLFHGVTRDNQDDIAAEVEQSDHYRITVGAGTYAMRSVLRVLKLRPEIQHYERIS
ncbi:hypothetical protein [Curtobacterium sp. 9128]|uniref:hypothetical protein n=1 Tax=Curtobacterium sp. 9128 TaxID=1793722 RepID=UPI0011A5E955|nr:hypothetical protein [Curtobacterium sp. 9128]